MELSHFLAQLFGFTLMIFSAVLMLRPMIVTVAIRDLRPFSFSMLMAGFAGIVGGLSIILIHNIWEISWRGLITLFGWSALIKGVTYVAFPDFLRFTATGMLNGKAKRNAALIVTFLVGAYLAYSGFYA